MQTLRDYFYDLADSLTDRLQGAEVLTCAFSGEDSDFIRFNRGRVRQAGHVTQQSITLDLIEGRRHAAAGLTLTGEPALDRPRLEALVAELRAVRAQVPDDPYLCYATAVRSGEWHYPDRLPAGAELVERVLEAGGGRDLVGILARGPVYAGFANSLGQRNWYARASFNLDWSFYLRADKAVKTRYAGFDWDNTAFSKRVATAVEHLEVLARPPRALAPGRYRVYLAPPALEEIMHLLAWESFGLRARHTGTTPLLRMIEHGARLHPALTLVENTAEGIAPAFQSAGFIRPDRVTLIEGGVYRESLVSPCSAVEYRVADNGAEDDEIPLSLDLAPGDIPLDAVLKTLNTGLYVGNLWYLNYSDRNAARLTGMTRFASYWVENGRIQAPLAVLRFDDTLYHLLGEGLIGLTQERELLLDPASYGARSTRSARLPGALIEAMRFTL